MAASTQVRYKLLLCSPASVGLAQARSSKQMYVLTDIQFVKYVIPQSCFLSHPSFRLCTSYRVKCHWRLGISGRLETREWWPPTSTSLLSSLPLSLQLWPSEWLLACTAQFIIVKFDVHLLIHIISRCKSNRMVYSIVYTHMPSPIFKVEPLYSGHHWDQQFCPLLPNALAWGT